MAQIHAEHPTRWGRAVSIGAALSVMLGPLAPQALAQEAPGAEELEAQAAQSVAQAQADMARAMAQILSAGVAMLSVQRPQIESGINEALEQAQSALSDMDGQVKDGRLFDQLLLMMQNASVMLQEQAAGTGPDIYEPQD